MSYMLPHLSNGWQVDQAILAEEDRVVLIRFGHDWDPSCMRMDEVFSSWQFYFSYKLYLNCKLFFKVSLQYILLLLYFII